MSSRPTPDSPARRLASPCAEGYGAHADAHPVVSEFADRVVEIIENAAEADAIPVDVAKAMAPVLATKELLVDGHRASDPDRYEKHVLFADPDHRFTLLALVWLPGQGTVVHAHTAWGAVGVYEGNPNVTCYDCEETADGKHITTETKDIYCEPGDTATVRPGLLDVHRIYNATDSTMITLHMYGCDLVSDPDAINLYLSQ